MSKYTAFDSAIAVYDINNYIFLDHLMSDEKSHHAHREDRLSEVEKEIFENLEMATPEDIYRIKEFEEKKQSLYNRLSAEAKDVLDIITDCPQELSHLCLSGNPDKVSIDRLATFLRKQWRERNSVREILNEIFMYATKIRKLRNDN